MTGIGMSSSQQMYIKEKTMNENFELVEDLGIIGRSENGYTKHLILSKWYKKPPSYEIRTFSPDGSPMKRCSMTPDELDALREILTTH